MNNNYTLKGNIVDINKNKIYKGIVYIENDKISRIEENKNITENNYILPGLVDAHMHVESSMLTPSQFASLAVKRGTVAIITDPHEIANVNGIEGVEFMIADSKKVPMKFFFGAPSCVPATSFETSGAILNADKVNELLKNDDIYFLSEMMNFPGVIYEDKDTIKKLEYAKKYNKPIDGHIPGIKGDDLKKYINAGVSTDHECVDLNEALEKISLGMKIQIREGSAAKNFNSLHTLIKTHNDKVMLCTDDSHPDDLTTIGHIDKIIKMGLNKGHNIIDLLKACVLNTKKHYNINLCTLQENDTADIIVVDNLENFKILETYINGEKVFSNNKINFSVEKISNPLNNFKLEKIKKTDLLIKNKNTEYKIINVIDGELVTTISKNKSNNEFIYSNTEKDILKIAVINRYKKDSKPIMGFIKNFNLKSGAIASSIAHDSHNVIAVGTNDDDLFKAINIIIENKGGICVVNKNYSDSLKLEIGGLMTSENSESVAKKYTDISDYTKNKLGSKLKSPFMTLSFMALLVIPELKIGDKGLFDFSKFNLTDLFE